MSALAVGMEWAEADEVSAGGRVCGTGGGGGGGDELFVGHNQCSQPRFAGVTGWEARNDVECDGRALHSAPVVYRCP